MATATAAASTKNHDTHKASLSAADQMAELDRQMEVLKQKKLSLSQEAIHEQKLRVSDAKKAWEAEEAKLELLTGKPTGEKKPRRERRPSIADEALKDQLLKVMANDGKEGMNAARMAEKLHQEAPRIRKFLKDYPKLLKRTGAAAATKYFLQ